MSNGDNKSDNRIYASSMSVKFCQEGNSLGTTADLEMLDVYLEAQTGDLIDGPFIVLKTPTGWSIDEPEELSLLLNRVLGAAKGVCEK